MQSIRKRLFVVLVVATGAIWLCAAAATYVWTRREIEHVFDARLQEASRMVASLAASSPISDAGTAAPADLQYERQLACQLWSFDGRLIARSSGAPGERLTDVDSGFSERAIDGETWRIFATSDVGKGLRVLVGDRLGRREQLVDNLIYGLVAPALPVLLLLAALIWSSLGRGLRPLARLAEGLGRRNADDLSLIDMSDAPIEVRPVVDALNNLFERLSSAVRRERDLTAFAAHELRTPLAGLKTHAQVALAASDPAVRNASLQQIQVSVDRAARLVRQLLDLAKVDADVHINHSAEVNVGALLKEIVDAARQAKGDLRVEIDPRLNAINVRADRELLTVALRNLHENALIYSPAHGCVRWRASDDARGLSVTDEGPGMRDEELPMATQRFFRGSNRAASGSGLGLAIVARALKRIDAKFRIYNRSGGRGLAADIELP